MFSTLNDKIYANTLVPCILIYQEFSSIQTIKIGTFNLIKNGEGDTKSHPKNWLCSRHLVNVSLLESQHRTLYNKPSHSLHVKWAKNEWGINTHSMNPNTEHCMISYCIPHTSSKRRVNNGIITWESHKLIVQNMYYNHSEDMKMTQGKYIITTWPSKWTLLISLSIVHATSPVPLMEGRSSTLNIFESFYASIFSFENIIIECFNIKQHKK